MPSREYYDRGDRAHAHAEELRPASSSQQEGYWLLRAQLTAALDRHWQVVCDSSPEIAQAYRNLESHLQRHPTRTFQAVRSQDAEYTIDSASTLFLR